ncbi:MAG: D-tyrosyl-tRNA(Tyr) deacylase [Phycisphaeraceae bacterium]|nr:D-tyrosyl-tRNA(Tyr) deacylase [Phycisphaeraceae bacterium]
MIAVVQRVRRAEVRLREDGALLGRIGPGLCVLLCAEQGDAASDAAWMVRRLAGLRIFRDGEGRMNLDCRQFGGGMLIVSQFTLAADTSRGHRPSFLGAAPPAEGETLVNQVIDGLRREGFEVETGRFGAEMELELINDGPVTIPLRSPAAVSDRSTPS